MAEAVKSNNDLWISEDDQVAIGVGPQNVEDALSSIDDMGLNPTIITNLNDQADPEPVVEVDEPEQIGPPPVVEEDDAQVYDYPDGSRVEIKKTKKGWRASLDPGNGANPEVFYGSTKDEMFANLAVGKINATRKIRELSRQPLLSEDEQPRPKVQEAQPAPAPHQWTTDEIFDLKAKLEESPALAHATWFQKETGMTLQELVTLTKSASQRSSDAQETSNDVAATQILQNWVEITDDYTPHPDNRDAIFAWLLKYKARQNPKNYDVPGAVAYLYEHDLLTTENLDLAWEDIKSDGRAVLARAADPEPEPAPAPVVKTRTRPAAGLGIRSSEARSTPRPTAVSDEQPDFSNMSLEESEKLMNDLRRLKIQNPAEFERLKAIGEAKRRG